MNPNTAPSPQLFFETINAYQRTSALRSAVDLDLFSAVGRTPSTADEIAERCKCPVRGIRILSDYLTILGFLTKNKDRYALTADSAVFLDRSSPAYIGETVQFFLSPDLTKGFAALTETIRHGTLQESERGTTEHDHSVWVDFARVMGPMMTPAARGTAELVKLDPERETKILDIAASHGTFGIALAARYPQAQLVALDWEAVLEVTTEYARAAGLANRFTTIRGDAFSIDLGIDYDVILLPNFLHHFSRCDCIRFLRRANGALCPGGSVVLVEFVPNDDHVSPSAAAGFSLVMLGSTPEGDAYSFSEYQSMLAEAGFENASLHPLLPTAESAVIAFKKKTA